MKKIIWLDCETTGLDPQKNGLIQIAMLADINGELVEEILVDAQPFPDDSVLWEHDDKKDHFCYEQAIYYPRIANECIIKPSLIPLSRIMEFDLPEEAHKNIVHFLDNHIAKFAKNDKAYVGGYNVQFDRAFLSEFFRKNHDNYLGSYMNWRCLDPLYILWKMDYKGKISLENYKLETVCKHLGIDISAHNAMSDIKATRELWYRLQTGIVEQDVIDEIQIFPTGMDEYGSLEPGG